MDTTSFRNSVPQVKERNDCQVEHLPIVPWRTMMAEAEKDKLIEQSSCRVFCHVNMGFDKSVR